MGQFKDYDVKATPVADDDFIIADSEDLDGDLDRKSKRVKGEKVVNPVIVDDLVSDDTDKPLSAKQGKTLKDLVDENTPAGVIEMYGGSSAPSGWLMCDGLPHSRTTYASLFAAIGIAFGGGDGSTTFNVPDFQGRSPKGEGTSSGGSDVPHVPETIELARKYNDKMQGHSHSGGVSGISVGAGAGSAAALTYTATSQSFGNFVGGFLIAADATNGTPRTGTTTTGKTLGINFIIKT